LRILQAVVASAELLFINYLAEKPMLRSLFLILALLTGASACAGTGPDTELSRADYMKLYKVKASFEDVRQYIELAITDRGMVINNVSHIGNMLERTGKDLGASKKIYDHAEALEFCSATVSRRMMEADPHNIVFCPYIIAIYTLPGEADTVYVAYRRPPAVGSPESRAALQAVEKLLDDIIRDAVL
jgi:uncharacterized protein (DUF302 family)